MFFVAGITGQVGGAAARKLLEGGRQVRTLARDPMKAVAWSQKGVDVREGDFQDAAAMAGALEGVEGAFLLMPPVFPTPGYPEAKAVVASYREALRPAPPPRLAILSSIGSERSDRLGNITSTHLLEQALDTAGFPTAFVRAGSFLENYVYAVKQAEATGAFDILLTPTNRAVPMIATADIGAEVARLLTDGWSGRKIVELGSRLSPDDLARALSEVVRRPVEARSLPREQWTGALGHMGIPAESIPLYAEMMDSFNSGWIDFGVAGTEAVAGTTGPAEVFALAKNG